MALFSLTFCLLFGSQLVYAEVFNYGGGSPALAGGGQPLVPQPFQGGGLGVPGGSVGGSWSPWSDLGTLFTTNPGSSWTYNPSSWTTGGSFNPFTNQGWTGWVTSQPWVTAPSTWTTWSAWVPSTGGPLTGAGLSSFTRLQGNCPGNYLGAVTQLTIDACAGACLSTAACAGFSFNLQSTYPQCILKNAVCATPDPNGVFTFFARNGYQPTFEQPAAQAPYYPSYPFPPYPYLPPYGPYGYPGFGYPPMGMPFWKSASMRQFKKYGTRYYEMAANCSAPILRGPYVVDLESCAEDCSAAKTCTGFSYDNTTNSCIAHSGICSSMSKSRQWSYFARGARPHFGTDGHEDSSAADQHVDVHLHVHHQGKPPRRTTPLTSPARLVKNPIQTSKVNPLDLLNRFEQLNGNCPGNPLGHEMRLSLDECARRCLSEYNCAGFTYNIKANRDDEYQCLLKTLSCKQPRRNSPYRFFRRRSLNVFLNPRFRQRIN